MRLAILSISLGLLAQAAAADEIVAAFGGSEISLEDVRRSGVAELSYRVDAKDDGVSPGAVLAVNEGGYVFAGAGVVGRQHFSGRWFVEAGGHLGIFSHDEGTDPAIRASVGLGRSFGGGTRASLGLAQVVSDDARLSSATLRFHLDI